MSVQSANTKLEIYVNDSLVQLCSTDHSLDFQMETDDITDMCSGGNRNTKSEIRQANISLNGIFDPADTALAKIKSRFFATSDETEGSIVTGWGQCAGVFTSASGDTYKGVIQINSYSESSTFNQEVRFSADMQFSGTITIA